MTQAQCAKCVSCLIAARASLLQERESPGRLHLHIGKFPRSEKPGRLYGTIYDNDCRKTICFFSVSHSGACRESLAAITKCAVEISQHVQDIEFIKADDHVVSFVKVSLLNKDLVP